MENRDELREKAIVAEVKDPALRAKKLKDYRRAVYRSRSAQGSAPLLPPRLTDDERARAPQTSLIFVRK